MKISCNMKQGTSLVKNSSQTVEIKDKTNEKKPYLEQNISNHKLDGSNLDHSIKIFNNLLLKGPIYICAQYANKHKATALHKAYWLPCCKLWSFTRHLGVVPTFTQILYCCNFINLWVCDIVLTFTQWERTPSNDLPFELLSLQLFQLHPL